MPAVETRLVTPDLLGHDHAGQHEEDAARDVADQQRLGPDLLGLAGGDRRSHELEDQAPDAGAEGVVDEHREDRRQQPDQVELDALLPQLGPLGDDREDEESEDQEGESALEDELGRALLGRLLADRGAEMAHSVEEAPFRLFLFGLGFVSHSTGHSVREPWMKEPQNPS